MPLLRLAGLALALCLPALSSSRAQHSSFRTYNADQGLASVGATCMVQDRVGYILACSEQGVFSYDGRRFSGLGVEQGLRDGGTIDGIVLMADGRIAVQYDGEIRISDRPSDATHPPAMLRFRTLLHPGIRFLGEDPHRLVAWHNGLALLAEDGTVRVAAPQNGPPVAEDMGYSGTERALLGQPTAIFSIRSHLWEALGDGRLCAADPAAVRCFGDADGLRGGPWLDAVAGPGGTVLARSALSAATLDPASGRWSTVALPDQGDRYANFSKNLGLFTDPHGDVVTQAEHGIAILHDGAWRTMSVAEGAPSGTIASAMTDAMGQFWLKVIGVGVLRWVGYGQWQSIEKADGLSDGFPWKTIGLLDGSIWVSTDTGLNELVRQGSSYHIGRIVRGSSFSLAVGPHGRLWTGYGLHGVRVVDPRDGSATTIETPSVNAILSDRPDRVWIGTENGLFRVEERPGAAFRAVPQGPSGIRVTDMQRDGDGGILYLADGRLRRRHRDGTDVAISGPWPGDTFDPVALTVGRNSEVWIGGSSGLSRVVLDGDRIVSCTLVPTLDIQSSTVVALMTDHRGWVWVGTALGVSVFDGTCWVSINADNGMLSDDVDQGGLREDPDGSIWIVTSHGLSHLLDPLSLFREQPIRVLVSDARLGPDPVTGRRVPYTDAALSVQFGTPNSGSERSMVFRYHLSGVDAGWADSASGTIRYAVVPPGRHLLSVVAYDRLTRRSSAPCSLVVDIAYPWWRSWWAEAAGVLAAVGLLYGLMQIRFRVMLARQAELRRHVAIATRQLREQAAQLQHQAAHDALTGLLNRSEVERRLARQLADGAAGAETIVALIDIDHFKRVNDRYGHLGGDDVLRSIGRLVSRAVRPGELAGRYGGEEILVVLHDADGRGAERVLDLHRAVQAEPLRAGGTLVRVSCSIGVAWTVYGDDWESLLGRADDALYQAKSAGRNRVVESQRIERVAE